MEPVENQHDKQVKNKHLSRRRRHAINQMAIGSIILLWGSLLALKQVGIIEKNVSTLPFALTAFGVLLVAGGIHRLGGLRRHEKPSGQKIHSRDLEKSGEVTYSGR